MQQSAHFVCKTPLCAVCKSFLSVVCKTPPIVVSNNPPTLFKCFVQDSSKCCLHDSLDVVCKIPTILCSRLLPLCTLDYSDFLCACSLLICVLNSSDYLCKIPPSFCTTSLWAWSKYNFITISSMCFSCGDTAFRSMCWVVYWWLPESSVSSPCQNWTVSGNRKSSTLQITSLCR